MDGNMTEKDKSNPADPMRIIVIRNGPYVVRGNVPLVSKTQVVSERGEPLTWKMDGVLATGEEEYHLCRCGQSSRQPFCDGCHRNIGFDGTESADNGETAHQVMNIPGSSHLQVRMDFTLCMKSGFCGLQDTSIFELAPASNDTNSRLLAISMVEHCPSGALTYRIDALGPDIEPDLPRQVAVTTEITADGPIPGPLWVTGGIPVERSNGQLLGTRHRVTLCNCGQSHIKPLCDGTHRQREQLEARRRRSSD